MTRFPGTDTYIATEDLMMAVNAAATLERPLLIKGEPGTGKTMLGVEVAKSLSSRRRPRPRRARRPRPSPSPSPSPRPRIRRSSATWASRTPRSTSWGRPTRPRS